MIKNFDINNIAGIAIDLVLVIIIVAAFVYGAKKGLIKMSMGLISSILVLVISIFAVTPVANLLMEKTQLGVNIATKLETPIGKQLPEPNLVIFYHDMDDNEDTPDVLVFLNEDDEYQSYDEIFESSMLGTFKMQELIKPTIENALKTNDSVYLVKALSYAVTTIIMLAITFVALLIVSKIVLSILFHLLRKAVSSLYVIHFVDKLTGAIFGLAIGAVVVLCLLAVLQLLQTFAFMDPVNLAIEKSYISKFAIDHNIIYSFIVKKVNIAAILDKIKIK